MSLFTINESQCTKDGTCVAECSLKLISMGASGPKPVLDAEKFCIRCGHCVAACPHDAMRHDLIPLEQCPPLGSDWRLTSAQVDQLLRGRRSVRNYKSKQVPREVIEKILDTVRFAPSGGNAQSLFFTVVESKDEVRRIAASTMEWAREAARNPEMAWANTLIESWERGEDPICRNAPHLVLTHVPSERAQMAMMDGVIALTFFELAALPYGIGTCWAGFVSLAAAMMPSVHDALQLPKGHQLKGGMMFGYQKTMFHRIPARNEAKIIWR